MRIKEQVELMRGLSPNKIWFIYDTHFFHNRVIEHCHRPFASVEEMNEEMIIRWNSVVHKDDIVFHLGDFCFGKADKWIYILERLKGRIYLILGNHDVEHITEDTTVYFEGIATQLRINVNGQKIYLNHFPFLSFEGDTRRTWQLFGHIHSNQHNYSIIGPERLTKLQANQYDVGVDNNNFSPVSYG